MAKQRAVSAHEPRPAGLSSEPGGAGDPGPAVFDRLIHERIRLGNVSAVAVNSRWWVVRVMARSLGFIKE